jgi:hypothetical protein
MNGCNETKTGLRRTVVYLSPEIRDEVDRVAPNFGGNSGLIRAALDAFFIARNVRKIDNSSMLDEQAAAELAAA